MSGWCSRCVVAAVTAKVMAAVGVAVGVAVVVQTAPTVAVAAPPHAMPLRGEALHRALHGLWCNSDDGGQSCWAWDEFLPDGRLRACGLAAGDPRPFFGEAVVRVDGQRLCYEVTAASSNFWLPVGGRYCTDIIDIGPNGHRYRDLDTGAEFTLLRRAATAATSGTTVGSDTAPHCPTLPDGTRP